MLSPRLRIVSIMPGIETAAPERTDTSSGFCAEPNFLPSLPSSLARCSLISFLRVSGMSPTLRYSGHISVEIVKPGGTGSPIFVISARPAPFPPRMVFISCLLYTSDAADDLLCVDLGGRRIIKKKKNKTKNKHRKDN